MKIVRILLAVYCLLLLCPCFSQEPRLMEKVYGQLFRDVQMQAIFPDGKTFADCIPRKDPASILRDYQARAGADTGLARFVSAHFELPAPPPQLNYIQQEKDLANHIRNLWGTLRKEAELSKGNKKRNALGGSLVPLPYPYIVPGGRNRELHYWDSYFIMLGLKESGDVTMMTNMVNDFAYLITKYGHVPAGNRDYYLSRSQPPFFSLMVELLAGIKGPAIFKKYLPSMEQEYAYWMEGADRIRQDSMLKHLVSLPGGSILNRYFDGQYGPRTEDYKLDFELAESVARDLAMRIRVSSPQALKRILDARKAQVYKHLGAAAESGWEFSSRWLSGQQKLENNQCADIVPVDLNCLLYALEENIAKAKQLTGARSAAAVYREKAKRRKAAIIKYCWSGERQFFVDYNAISRAQSPVISGAGLYPLFVNIATPEQATAVETTTRQQLLSAGGLLTSAANSGQQWDAPNGWAPLQWISVTGLRNYQKHELAKAIAERWLNLNENFYAGSGKLMEKYNVEADVQQAINDAPESMGAFGWTGGVYLALKKIYSSP
jgi:alpha,alpha-trehalase